MSDEAQEMLTLPAFEQAAHKVREVTQETKLIESPHFSEIAGNRVFFKPENMQRTGAYKVRGAYYKISTLSDDERKRGLITASAGNHAQGVAYAAQRYGVPATIVMPATTPYIKVERTKALGAEVVLAGDVYDEAYARALELAEERGLTFVHPFNDLGVATGQGTIAMEIVQELPLVDYILVPIGGGGLATGVSTLAKLLNPHIKVIGVEPAGAACMKASLEAGHVVKLPHVSTIADGTAVQEPGDKIFPYLQQNLDGIITVEDEELIVAFLDMVENHKMIVENSGLLTVAALQPPRFHGKEGRVNPLGRQHGRHHHVVSRAARPNPARPHLHGQRAPARPPRRARQRCPGHRREQGQRRPTRPQPVRHDKPQRRRGAARDHRGVRHRAQAANRRGARGKGLPPAPYPGAPVSADQAGVVSRPQSTRHHPTTGANLSPVRPCLLLEGQ